MKQQSKQQAQQVVQHIHDANTILIASHVSPDGDALGASAGMAHIANALGKKTLIYNESGVPHEYAWLNFGTAIVTTVAEITAFNPDLVIVVDCGAPARVGSALRKVLPQFTSINIDHHLENPQFGTLFNWVEEKYSATCQLVGEIAHAAGLVLKDALGEAVYLGLSTDTGSFRYSSTRPEVLEMAAGIIRQGLDPGLFSERHENQWTLGKMKLWCDLTSQVQLFYNSAVVVSTVTNATLARYACSHNDLEGFVSHIRRLAGVRYSVFIRENTNNHVKVSLRSSGTDNVQQIATQFGGGGHKNASGIDSKLSIDEMKNKLIEAIGAIL